MKAYFLSQPKLITSDIQFMTSYSDKPIVFFDGECIMCNQLVDIDCEQLLDK